MLINNKGFWALAFNAMLLIIAHKSLAISLQDKTIPPKGPRVDFSKTGSKGDGMTDNTKQLQQSLDNFDTVYIPNNFTCRISKTINLHSNNVLIGSDSISSIIDIDADRFAWDKTWNPAAFVNDQRQEWSEHEKMINPNSKVAILNLKFVLHADTIRNMQSILRFSNISGIEIKGCKFLVQSNGLSHNAIVDLHSAYRNAVILNNSFEINTNSIKSGGAIWVQNASLTMASGVRVMHNTFKSSGKDETLGVFTDKSDFKVFDVKIDSNEFTINPTTPTNNSSITIYGGADSVDVKENKFYILSDNKTIDGVIRLGLWHDRENQVNLLRNINIENNTAKGNLDKSLGIRGYSGNSVRIKGNSFQGRNGQLNNAINPPKDSLQATWNIQQ